MSSLYFADQRRQAQRAQEEERNNDGSADSSSSSGLIFPHVTSDEFEDEAADGSSSSASSLTEFTGMAPSTTAAAQLSVGSNPLDQREESSPLRSLPTATAVGSVSSHSASSESEMETASAADDKDDSSSTDSATKKWTKVIIACFSCLLVVMIAAGIGIGVAMSRERNAESTTSSPFTVPGPTLAPTIQPTSSAIPTARIDPPINNICAGAMPLAVPQTVKGSTEFATVEEVQPYLTDCGVETFDGPSVWFRIDTVQNAPITVSTCGTTEFKTRLAVFSGESSCSTLQCVVQDDPRVTDNCNVHASVSWVAEQDTTYYILLRGFREDSGNFKLVVNSDLVPNDSCAGAIEVEINGNDFVQGSTVAATIDNAPCGGLSTLEAPGVWYRVIGDGNRLVVSTCWGTEFDSAISVFRGECGKLTCVAANDDHSSCGEQSRVEFDSVASGSYFILVHGYRGQSGPFLLNVASEGSVYNDFCDNAQSLPLETLVHGSNIYANYDFGNEGVSSTFCGSDIEISGPTVWYRLFGTGGQVAVSLCNSITDFDTQLSVFTGDSCDSLNCLSGNDEAEAEECGFTSELAFQTELFQRYLVAVHGFQAATGKFAIFLEDLGGEPSFDSCEDAGGPVPLNEETSIFLSNSTTISNGLYQCDEPLDLEATQWGAWLYLEGDGGEIAVSLCDDTGDSIIFVFTGSCSSLTCVQGTSNGCSVTFLSVENEQYYLFLRSDEVIDKLSLFVSITGKPPEINDSCEQAIPLVLDSGVPVNGTTVGASFDQVPGGVCGEAIDSPGVWYSIEGTGEGIAVGLCTETFTSFDTKISVFENSCDDLVCVGGNDDWCELQSAYGWVSKSETTYFILVHGDAGAFEILAVTS